MRWLEFVPSQDLLFDAKVSEMCRSCKRYGKKATCPPYIPAFEHYAAMLPRFARGLFAVEEFVVSGERSAVGIVSSLAIWNAVVSKRNELIAQGHTFAVAFGAGSCKLCPTCGGVCAKPDKSLVPLEATGLDLVKTLAPFDVAIKFPVKTEFYRVGAVFYD